MPFPHFFLKSDWIVVGMARLGGLTVAQLLTPQKLCFHSKTVLLVLVIIRYSDPLLSVMPQEQSFIYDSAPYENISAPYENIFAPSKYLEKWDLPLMGKKSLSRL